MQKITEKFTKLNEDKNFVLLHTLTRSFYTRLPSAEITRKLVIASLEKSEEKPEWFKYYTEKAGTPLKEILTDVCSDSKEGVVDLFKSISECLAFFFNSTCTTFITEKNAEILVSSGHPVCIWLYEGVDLLDASCAIALFLFGFLELTCPPPLYFTRIPELTARFRQFVYPIMIKNEKKARADIAEFMPEYAALNNKFFSK